MSIYTVIRSYGGGDLTPVHDLSNGVTIRELGDGRASGSDGQTYWYHAQGVGDPDEDGEYADYVDLGWSDDPWPGW